MGQDIHLFVEFPPNPDSDGFRSLTEGPFHLQRNYLLFGRLGSSRGGGPKRPARGIPANVSRSAAGCFYLPVLTRKTAAGWGLGDEHYYTPEQAAEAVASSRAQWKPEATTAPLYPSRGGYVSMADWHSPSWATAAEFFEDLSEVQHVQGHLHSDYRVLQAILQVVEREYGPRTRITYWFDN